MLEAAAIGVLQRQLEGVAEEMGAVLVRSALSSNIKERRDSSTALFDADGMLLAQAAHIPVHLGSMGHAVRAVADRSPRDGEVWILNDPFAGGTHLPDITLVCPIEGAEGRLGYAAVRAHHADVGGTTPGSMSAAASTIADEGIRITPTVIGLDGQLEDMLVEGLTAGMRQSAERRGDLLAQAAALTVARRRLPLLAQAWGGDRALASRLHELVDYGERRCRAVLAGHEGAQGSASIEVEVPQGVAPCRIEAVVEVGAGSMVVDLSASSDQSATSLNCPLPVTSAAVMFAVRSTLDPDLPTSGGVERPIRIVTRRGSVVDAVAPAAVAGGNVEVSSLVVDAVVAAIGTFADVPAAGQGTMNNLVLGNDRFSYYETLAGGAGAGAVADGPSAVHVAMTNTRNTPIEALEIEFPLRIERYAVRRGSGGAGARRGGDGVVRAIRVLESCTFSVLAQHRRHAPSGRAGGSAGEVGVEFVNDLQVTGLHTGVLEPGDVIEVRTPGGGGYGKQ